MRYFFDIQIGDRSVADPDGTELADVEAAEIEASQTIAEIALELVPGTLRKTITIVVRDDSGVCLTLELTFSMVRR